MARAGRISTAESFQYGQIALRLQDSLKANESKAQLAFIVHGMINLYVSNNLSDCVKALHDGHLEGLRAGYVRQAMLCAQVMCIIYFHSGESLANVTSTVDKFTSLMRDYNLPVVLRVNLMYQKAVATLTGLVHTSRCKDTNKKNRSVNRNGFLKNLIKISFVRERRKQFFCFFGDTHPVYF